MKWWVVIVAVIIVVLAVWGFSRPAAAPPQPVASSTPEIIAGVPNDTYTNTRLSFSIQYPSTATSSEFDFSGYLPLTQTSVASFVLPKSMSAGTNLGDAGVYIGATTTPSVMQTCESPIVNGGETVVATSTIGGQDFASFTSSDAGAGNFYESKIFRTYQNGVCLEIVELLHSGNIGNYTPGTVVEFDHAQFQNILDGIVQTYYPIPTGP